VEEIGLFPLGVVLLPTERIPLHIFEPRYRELIGECLDEEREFGLLFADDDGMREVGTRAGVIEVLERHVDGRLDIVVEGRERFRLQQLTEGRSYHTAVVEAVEDEPGDALDEDVELGRQELHRVAELAGADLDELELETETPSYELAARVELEPEVKQQLLELTSEAERMRAVVDVLRRIARAIEVRRESASIASTNGKVPIVRDDDEAADGDAA
jgi:Lon protease-like protein